jgi:hypothetical protein
MDLLHCLCDLVAVFELSKERVVGMPAQFQYASFLIRIWRESEAHETYAEWESEVEHIQSGEIWKFHTLKELEVFFRQRSLDPAGLIWTQAQGAEQ